jgi:hypothetical protein
MQEIIVLSIAVLALVYLGIKFIIKPKDHNCEKCGLSDNLESKEH